MQLAQGMERREAVVTRQKAGETGIAVERIRRHVKYSYAFNVPRVEHCTGVVTEVRPEMGRQFSVSLGPDAARTLLG